MTKVIVLCLTATCAVTARVPGTGVRVIGFSPVRLTFDAANEDAVARLHTTDGRVLTQTL